MNHTKQTESADVVLVYPRTGYDFGPTVAPPHSILTVAAPLHKAGYKVKIIDQRRRVHWKKELREVLKSKPMAVGVSSMIGTQIQFAIEAGDVVRECSDGDIPIMWGGPHPTIEPVQTLAHRTCDVVCVGEGDYTMLEFVRAIENKASWSTIPGIVYRDGSKVVTTPARPLCNMEELPETPWELIDPEDYIHPDIYLQNSPRTLDIGQTSRGCPFDCGFCCSASIRERKWRRFDVERSVEHIVGQVRRFNLTGFWLRDDEFYISRPRTQKILEAMVKENLGVTWYTSGSTIEGFNRSSDELVALMEASGGKVLKMGAESGSARVLHMIAKAGYITPEDTIKANLRIKKTGMDPVFALMVGFPTETWDEIHSTIDLAYRLKRDNPRARFESLAIYTPMPGTPMWQQAIDHGLRPPQSLEEYIHWNVEERDIDGRKSPWLNNVDRMSLTNLSTMFTLVNGVRHAINGVNNPVTRSLMKMAAVPVLADFNYRLKKRYYRHVPEAILVEKVRDMVFRNGGAVFE